MLLRHASANERPWKAFVQKEVVPLTGRVQFKWYDELSFEDILKDAANLPPNTAIFWLLMNVDAAGVAHEGRTALMRLAAVGVTDATVRVSIGIEHPDDLLADLAQALNAVD